MQKETKRGCNSLQEKCQNVREENTIWFESLKYQCFYGEHRCNWWEVNMPKRAWKRQKETIYGLRKKKNFLRKKPKHNWEKNIKNKLLLKEIWTSVSSTIYTGTKTTAPTTKTHLNVRFQINKHLINNATEKKAYTRWLNDNCVSLRQNSPELWRRLAQHHLY